MTLQARKETQTKVSLELARTKDECSTAAALARTAQVKLEEAKLAAASTEEEARSQARRPLEQELREVGSQLEQLKARYGKDFDHQEAAWKEHLLKCERNSEALWQSTEATLQDEVS